MEKIFNRLETGFQKQGSAVEVKKTINQLGLFPQKHLSYGKV